MSSVRELPDLSICEKEPIHIPGSIEPNGALVVLREPDLTIVQASANTGTLLGIDAQALTHTPLADVLHQDSLTDLQQLILIHDLDGKRRYLTGVRVRATEALSDASIHRHQGLLIVELEPAAADTGDLYASLTDALADLDCQLSLVELCQRVAAHVRRLTSFDRVMIYQFLEDDTGCVIAEDRRDDLQPYLGLRYPASDIPSQARRLYLLNTIRLKADVSAQRVPLVPEVNPLTGQPLDMSYCILRAMSPVHDEYLRNMGVSASMSVSIVKDGRLWGLIACHHTTPKTVPHPMRISCEALARVFSARIGAAEDEDRRRGSSAARDYREQVEERLRRHPEVRNALRDERDRLASAINSSGVSICFGGHVELAGATPSRENVEAIVEWLDTSQNGYIFWTDKLSEQHPAADGFAETSTGLLSARIALGSRDFILWFRPPAVKVVSWAGNPSKPVEETESGKRLSPRRSFELWKQTVGDRSEPWKTHEREFALALRQTVAEVLLTQKNREVMHLNVELERSNIELDAFAYAASHDLQEPVRTVRSYAQLLARRTSSKLDEESLKLIKVIEVSAVRMGNLIAALLAYGQVGGSARRERKPVNVQDVLSWVLMNLEESVRTSGATVTNDELPVVQADPEQLTQLIQNLVGNAIKYRRPEQPPRVHVSAARQCESWLFGVRDNGQGFEQKESQSIFGAFKRLHGRDIPGTGIGLALCKRIVEHHGGRIWAESKGKGQGATFWFTLPQS